MFGFGFFKKKLEGEFFFTHITPRIFRLPSIPTNRWPIPFPEKCEEFMSIENLNSKSNVTPRKKKTLNISAHYEAQWETQREPLLPSTSVASSLKVPSFSGCESVGVDERRNLRPPPFAVVTKAQHKEEDTRGKDHNRFLSSG